LKREPQWSPQRLKPFFIRIPIPNFRPNCVSFSTPAGGGHRRNDVAHGKIGGSPVDLNRCALWRADSNTRKQTIDYRAAFAYNSGIIKEFSRQVMTLLESLWQFERKFETWRQEQLGEHPWSDHLLPNP
jgi:hypothetical protein